MRYFFHIGYKGSAYKGWQRQVDVSSVQEVLEDKLSRLLKTKINCIGCGRTDAGVHASQYFFHIDTVHPWQDEMLLHLNQILTPDIAVFSVFEVEKNQHAQFDALERTYNYLIHTSKNPFTNELSAFYPIKPDIYKMNKAAQLLLNYSNFRAFCKTPDRHNHTLCTIHSVRLYTNKQQNQLRIELTANRFLKGMVRIIVNELLHVGTNQLSIAEFESYLKNQTPPKFLKLAYPQGLYLSKIKYSFVNVPANPDFLPSWELGSWELI